MCPRVGPTCLTVSPSSCLWSLRGRQNTRMTTVQMSLNSRTLTTCVGGDPYAQTLGNEPETTGSPRWEVLGFSFTGQTEQQLSVILVTFFSASLHPQVLLSDCRESCFWRQPSSQQSVDIFAFAVQMVTTQAFHRSCMERTYPGRAEAAELLGCPASPGNQSSCLFRKGLYLRTNLQFNCTPFRVIPLLKSKRRGEHQLTVAGHLSFLPPLML